MSRFLLCLLLGVFCGNAANSQDLALERLKAFQQKTSTRIEQRVTTINRPVFENRVQNYVVNVPVTEFYWIRQGRFCVRCSRIVFRQEIRQQTIRIQRFVAEQRTSNVTFTENLPPLDSIYSGSAFVSANLGRLPQVTEVTFNRMKGFFLQNIEPSYDQPEKIDDPATTNITEEILNVRSRFHRLNNSGPYFRVYVDAVPNENEVFINVKGFKLRAGTDTNNITNADFLIADSELSDYLNQQATSIKQAFER